MTGIRAVIFDMDGVLIDARDWHYQALNRALGLFGMEISEYDHLVTYDGLPTRKKLEMLSQERGLPIKLHSFINRLKQQYTMEIVHARCKPNFIHEYALAKLRSDGYRIAVCSNAIRMTVDVMLEKASLTEFVEFSLSNEDVKQAKPDPEIYRKAINKLSLDPGECLVVEDNENGIKAGRASGAHVMPVRRIVDVNYQNITQFVQDIQGDSQ